MTTKQYLEQIGRYDFLIESKISERKHLQSLATGAGINYSCERVQTSPNPDRMGDIVSKIVDMQSEISELISEYLNKKNEVIQTIESIDDIRFHEILYKRYVDGKSLGVISEEMHINYDYTKHLHIKALDCVKKMKGFKS